MTSILSLEKKVIMKIIIFGATGTVGKQLVIQALGMDHQVTAFIRGAKGPLVEFEHDNLHFIEGDVLDPKSVHNAIEGHEAVFCVLGAGKKGGVRAPGTRNIIDAMEKHRLRRFICQSTLGAGDSRDNLNFIWRHIMFGWLLKEAYEDHHLQEKYVKASNLDWTLVRPGAFTDGPATGNFKHGFPPTEKGLKLKVSRADVALFLLQQLESDKYIQKTPGLSY